MKTLLSALIISFFVLGCGSEETVPEVVLPTNLEIEVVVSSDGSGKVDITATADNANFYSIFFGDVNNEIPTKTNNGQVTHTYQASNNYTIIVRAHATESNYISKIKQITVTLATDNAIIPSTGYSTSLTYEGMSLVWNDEFEGSTLNNSYWQTTRGSMAPRSRVYAGPGCAGPK